jgi:hypothetical protein
MMMRPTKRVEGALERRARQIRFLSTDTQRLGEDEQGLAIQAAARASDATI